VARCETAPSDQRTRAENLDLESPQPAMTNTPSPISTPSNDAPDCPIRDAYACSPERVIALAKRPPVHPGYRWGAVRRKRKGLRSRFLCRQETIGAPAVALDGESLVVEIGTQSFLREE